MNPNFASHPDKHHAAGCLGAGGSFLAVYVALRPVAELLLLMQSMYSVQENLNSFRVKIMQMALVVISSKILLDHPVLSECGCASQQTLALMTLQCLL